ncbi:hypothetical protein ACJX0J_024696, partial [Zea mays]
KDRPMLNRSPYRESKKYHRDVVYNDKHKQHGHNNNCECYFSYFQLFALSLIHPMQYSSQQQLIKRATKLVKAKIKTNNSIQTNEARVSFGELCIYITYGLLKSKEEMLEGYRPYAFITCFDVKGGLRFAFIKGILSTFLSAGCLLVFPCFAFTGSKRMIFAITTEH